VIIAVQRRFSNGENGHRPDRQLATKVAGSVVAHHLSGVGVVFIVQAVHDLDFELDGNIVNDRVISNGLFD
jgi:hypothetical protein